MCFCLVDDLSFFFFLRYREMGVKSCRRFYASCGGAALVARILLDLGIHALAKEERLLLSSEVPCLLREDGFEQRDIEPIREGPVPVGCKRDYKSRIRWELI